MFNRTYILYLLSACSIRWWSSWRWEQGDQSWQGAEACFAILKRNQGDYGKGNIWPKWENWVNQGKACKMQKYSGVLSGVGRTEGETRTSLSYTGDRKQLLAWHSGMNKYINSYVDGQKNDCDRVCEDRDPICQISICWATSSAWRHGHTAMPGKATLNKPPPAPELVGCCY